MPLPPNTPGAMADEAGPGEEVVSDDAAHEWRRGTA